MRTAEVISCKPTSHLGNVQTHCSIGKWRFESRPKYRFFAGERTRVAPMRQPSFFICPRLFPPSFGNFRPLGFPEDKKGICPMRLVKIVAALTSFVAAGCSMFAVGWIGLALLGY